MTTKTLKLSCERNSDGQERRTMETSMVVAVTKLSLARWWMGLWKQKIRSVFFNPKKGIKKKKVGGFRRE